MTLAALEATLSLARDSRLAVQRIPLLAFLSTPIEALRGRAERLVEALRSDPGLSAELLATQAFLGGGSVPAEPIPSMAVRVVAPFPAVAPTETAWSRALRVGAPPVVPRVQGGAVLFDLRAVPEADDEALLRAIRQSARLP
jgi:L-seryl-tRNA(Ser) seleniumtransferase